jgi:excisionase family DNA binding protein
METMTETEAAQRLGVTVYTIRNYRKDGRLTQVKVGRRKMVTTESVERRKAHLDGLKPQEEVAA